MESQQQKLTLAEWASVGEVVGTIAVVVSLLFVVYSINQNTDAVQGSTENLIFERHTELTNHVMTDPSLAAIIVKMKSENPELSDVEAVRWEKYQNNLLDIWALAYNRHEARLMADEQWEAWDRYFVHTFSEGAEKLSKERWQELGYGYARPFWQHVGESLF